MKLLFVSHSAGLLGAERSLLEMVEEAIAEGFDVSVTVPGDGPLRSAVESRGATCQIVPNHAWMGPRHHIPPLGVARLLQAGLAVPRHSALLKRLKPDVVVTNSSIIPAAAWAAALLDVPHIWIVREAFVTNTQLRSKLSPTMLAREISRRSSAICAVSGFVENQLRAHLKSPHAPILPIRPRPILVGNPKNHSGFKPTGRLRLILPGFISSEKGQDLAVAALALLRDRPITVTLDILGRGTRLSILGLRMQILRLGLRGRIRILPWTNDPIPAYLASDALLMSSRNEAFGRTTAEALLLGLPVIGLDSGGTTELLRNGGGELVHPMTPRALAEVIERWALMGPDEWADLHRRAQEAGESIRMMPSQFAYLRAAVEQVVRKPALGSGAAVDAVVSARSQGTPLVRRDVRPVGRRTALRDR